MQMRLLIPQEWSWMPFVKTIMQVPFPESATGELPKKDRCSKIVPSAHCSLPLHSDPEQSVG